MNRARWSVVAVLSACLLAFAISNSSTPEAKATGGVAPDFTSLTAEVAGDEVIVQGTLTCHPPSCYVHEHNYHVSEPVEPDGSFQMSLPLSAGYVYVQAFDACGDSEVIGMAVED